jgi:hypothetical protein
LELNKLSPEKAAAAGNDLYGVGLELCSFVSAYEHFHSLVTFVIRCSIDEPSY